VMHEPEKSDSVVVAGKPTNKAARAWRSRWSQGRRPRGTRVSTARAGRRTG
jgi:NADH:ubiquinone oxidoreductase subunit B-like Fe-S oxidoreductase